MGWGIYIRAKIKLPKVKKYLKEIYLNRITKNSDFQSLIDDCNDIISYNIERILMLSISDNIERIDKDGELISGIDFKHKELKDCIESIEEEAINRYLYQLALDYPEDIIGD